MTTDGMGPHPRIQCIALLLLSPKEVETRKESERDDIGEQVRRSLGRGFIIFFPITADSATNGFASFHACSAIPKRMTKGYKRVRWFEHSVM